MAAAETRRCPTCGAHYPLDFVVCPMDATSLEQPSGSDVDPLVGEVLAGSYKVTRLLGSGGMGRVYEAEHLRLPRRFAVKLMHEQLASNADAVTRFEREAQAAAHIAHDHVIGVVDVVRVQGRPCIVHEMLDGEELGERLDRVGKLPLNEAITICRQVCRGLSAAHAAQVIHRDLKPANLFLVKRDDGALHVKILDFGVAKLEGHSELTGTGMILGTPAFMAPEQALRARDTDHRADIYAVGALLYRMLTGRTPFPEDDPTVTLARLMTEDPRRPRDIDKGIPEGVEALIQKAMAREPASRPASAMELDRLLAPFEEARRSERTPKPSVVVDEARLSTMDTITASILPGAAEDATRRARRARPAALLLSIVASVIAGLTALTAAVVGLRALLRVTRFDEVHGILIALLASLGAAFVLLAALRVLFTRWRSAPAIQRLAEALLAALLWYLVPLGLIALLTRGLAMLSILAIAIPGTSQAITDLVLILVPTFLGGTALTLGLRRARRT